jgi:hypothetical protein
MRIEQEQAEKVRAAREAEEEERAREARETATARDRVAIGEGRSEKEMGVEGQDEVREGRGNEEGSAGGATVEKACGSEGAKTTQAASQTTAAGSMDPGTLVENGADGGKETRTVEIEEVEGIRLGPAWDARDLSCRLSLGDIQVSQFCFPFLNVDS